MTTDRKQPANMLTLGQVSQILDLSRAVLRRLADRGAIRTYRTGERGDRRFRPEDVAIFLLMENKGFQLNLDLTDRRRGSAPGRTDWEISRESFLPLRHRKDTLGARNP